MKPDEGHNLTSPASLGSIAACPSSSAPYQVCTKKEVASSYALSSETLQPKTSTQEYYVCGNAEVGFDFYKSRLYSDSTDCYKDIRTFTTGTQHICVWSRYESTFVVASYYKHGRLDHTSRNLGTYRLFDGHTVRRKLTTDCPAKP